MLTRKKIISRNFLIIGQILQHEKKLYQNGNKSAQSTMLMMRLVPLKKRKIFLKCFSMPSSADYDRLRWRQPSFNLRHLIKILFLLDKFRRTIYIAKYRRQGSNICLVRLKRFCFWGWNVVSNNLIMK